jgi:hypothetical protein
LKTFRFISILLTGIFLLNSCEKIIEFDLSESKEVVVIEASITSNRGIFTVLVSKTSPYFGVKSNNLVSGAKVSIRAEKGNAKYFTETAPGVYKLEKIIAMPGYWYIIDVELDGIHYTARSFLYETVPIIDLTLSYFDGFGFFDSGYKINCFIRDPVEKENFYRIKYFVNGNPVDDTGEISLYSDKLFNGKVVGLGQRSLVFSEDDTLTVELQTIDKATYDYFTTLESISGNVLEQSASPANPITNFNNGALGYFSAYSFDRKTLILKDYLKKK